MGALQLARRLGTLSEIFRNPQLGRIELAWGGRHVGEWASFVALSIWAFEHGGATAVGVLGLVRMGATAIALPFGGILTDRYPRQRVLLGIYLARAMTLGGTAAALAMSSPRPLVFALAGIAAAAAATVRPAMMSLVPLLVRTPSELVSANVASSTLEGAGTFLGPVLGGTLAVSGGIDVAVGVAAVTYLACALLVAGIRREGDVAARPRTERGRLAELLRGVRTLTDEPHPRLIVFLFVSQAFVRGLLNVLVVVAALDLLGMGRSGVGWLNAALGAGGLTGGLVAVGLVGRRKLALPLGLALILWGAPIALVGAWPQAGWALICIGGVGVGNAVLGISGYTILQRTVDEHVLGRVLGVLEILVAVAVALGSVLGSLQVAEIGIRPALLVSGLFLPALAIISYPRLRRIDAASTVPERELALVSSLPLFAPLPVNTLERLSFRLEHAKSEAGTTIVEQSSVGDRFYIIGSGEVDVIHNDVLVTTLGPGAYFGEVSLLQNVDRTADCVARTDVELYALSRETLIAAVGGDLRSTGIADEVMTQRLSASSPNSRPREARPRDTAGRYPCATTSPSWPGALPEAVSGNSPAPCRARKL